MFYVENGEVSRSVDFESMTDDDHINTMSIIVGLMGSQTMMRREKSPKEKVDADYC